jgi:hypothetical protein
MMDDDKRVSLFSVSLSLHCSSRQSLVVSVDSGMNSQGSQGREVPTDWQ